MDKSAERLVSSASSSDGSPPSKRHCASGDSSAKDAQPKIRKINEILAVELLEMIVRCVPTKSPGKVWLAEELSEIIVTRQFQLRYLCRLWRSIVYRNTKLTVVLTRAVVARRRRETRRIAVRPAGFQFKQAAGLFEALNNCCAGRLATLDGAGWTELIARVRLNWNGEKNDESIISVLTRLTKSIRHPICLDLKLPMANMTGAIKHNFRIPFVTRFPNLTLIKLDLYSACRRGHFVRKHFIYSSRLTNFYLKGASNQLTELHVSLLVLDKALAGFRTRRNASHNAQHWTCHSLRLLKLWIAPPDTETFDGDNVEKRIAAFAMQAKLPTWFPQLKQLQLDWDDDRFQFDFTVLQNFAALDELILLENFYLPYVLRDCRLQSLPSIQTLALSGNSVFPMDLALFVPNVCQLSIFDLDLRTCEDLTRQLTANANALQNLRRLSLGGRPRYNFRLDWYWCPTPRVVRHFLEALECAPRLKELEIKNVRPPDDLWLFNSIPEGVVKLTLDCCLMPDWVGYDYDDETYYTRVKRATLRELNEIYKEWILDLLCRLADFPALKEFCCVVPTPKFRTARNLVAHWRRNTSKLAADLNSYSLKGINFNIISVQSIDFDPVDTSANYLGLTIKLLASTLSFVRCGQIVARIVFKDADYVT